jgi:protein required for attachment to host cells
MKDDTWIMVADATKAHVFSTHAHHRPWRMLRTLRHDRSAARGIDLLADAPGRVQQRVGGSRSAMEPRTDPTRVEAERFARELAAVLESGRTRGDYHHLVLIAPPQFLGLLRACATEEVRKTVSATVDHDWTEVAAAELPDRLDQALG